MIEGLEELFLSVQERMALLEKSRLGSGLTWQELQTLAGYFDSFSAQPDTYVCHQGERSDFICIVCQGRVGIVKEDLQLNRKMIATIGPGQSVGEMAVIDGEPRSASVIVQSQALLLVLDTAQFDRMSEVAPRLWGKFLLQLSRILSRRLRQTSGVLAEYLQS